MNLKSKVYPNDYSEDAVKVLDCFLMGSGTDLKLVGSASLRSQQYYGDFDAYCIVRKNGNIKTVLHDLRLHFQNNIKKLRAIPNTFIGDVKAGSIEKWRIIPKSAKVVEGKIVGYNSVQSKGKVDELLKKKVITDAEAKEAMALLTEKVEDFLIAKQTIKFHIIRWNVDEILHDKKVLRDGKAITLEESFKQPSITKIDVISLINNRFVEFSCIYQFECNNKVLNPDINNVAVSLKEDILSYKLKGNYFKVLKRLFTLAKLESNSKLLNELIPILNSNLGLLYLIVNDIEVLIELLERNIPLDKIRYEIDQFVSRLSNVYTIPEYLSKDDTIIGEIHRILKLPHKQLIPALMKLQGELNDIVQKKAKPIVDRLSG